MEKLKAHIQNIALHHTIFDLPFAYMGAFLAAGGIPELSVYDNNFQYVKDLGQHELRSGIQLWRQLFHGSDGDILYNRYFYNDILSYSSDSLRIKYTVDFGSHTMSNQESMQDEYDCIEYLNAHQDKFASMISNIEETSRTFSFQFSFDANRYITIFDKNNKKSETYSFRSDEYYIQQLYCHDGKILVFALPEKEGGFLIAEYPL